MRSTAIILSVAIVLSASLLLIHKWDKRHGSLWENLDNDNRQTIRYNEQWYVLRDELETVLVMGLDKFETDESLDSYNNSMQADFLMLMVLDKDNDSVTALHLNRDAMAQIDILGLDGETVGTFNGQLALAHTYGSGGKDSCKNTVKAVSNFLYEVPIDHYISVTMDAVQTLNDLVGGVKVEVLDDFTGIDESLKKGEEVTLRGQQALTYVRTRKDLEDSSNAHRMKRQQQYMTALYQRIGESVEQDEGFITDAAVKLADYMVSDCTVNQLERIADFIAENKVGEIRTVEGESKLGEKFIEFYPDEASLQALIIEMFFEPKK